MTKGITLPSTVDLLPAAAGIAVAAPPPLGPFTTTGYTTNGEFSPLSGGWLRFHVVARGGNETEADNLLCEAAYGRPCQDVCLGFLGQACGVTGSFQGAFEFDEWGVVQVLDNSTNPPRTGYGANHGLVAITAAGGDTNLRFDGQTDSVTVYGSFQLLDGGRGAKGPKVSGTYLGNGGYVFAVTYTPCAGPQGTPSPTIPCAVSSGALKMEKGKVKWEFSNEDNAKLTLSSLRLWWPAANGAIEKVKLGKLAIADPGYHEPGLTDPAQYWTEIDLSGYGDRPQHLDIAKGKKMLELTFNGPVSQDPADYVFLARFAEGCAATYVGWPPATP